MLKVFAFSADTSSVRVSQEVVSDPRVVRVRGRASTCEPWGRRDGQMNRESLAPAERKAANRVERRRAARALREEVEA
jgi:hypothetical protein